MEQQKIRELIDVLMASDLAELEFVQGDCKLRLIRRALSEPTLQLLPEADVVAADGCSPPASKALAPESTNQSGSAGTLGSVIRSPLYGILHLTSAPDAPAFVQAGELVHPGQTLCIVEAMKIFHEVKAESHARVDAILAQAGQEVDAGAVLFRLADTA